MGRALARVPTWAWLTAIVVGSAALRALLARQLVAPFIMVDELDLVGARPRDRRCGRAAAPRPAESGLQRRLPASHQPRVRRSSTASRRAYAAVKTMNAVLMSLAAIPAFFLARRVVRRSYALLAALLAVAVPSLAYTGTVMTENAFYPLFLVVSSCSSSPSSGRRRSGSFSFSRSPVSRTRRASRRSRSVRRSSSRRSCSRCSSGEVLRETVSRFRWLYGIVLGAAVAALVVQAARRRPARRVRACR